ANLKVVKKELQKAGLPEAEELVRLGQIQESIRMKNWKELASVLNAVSKKGQRVYGQAVPVTLGQYVPTLLKESAGKYSKQAHQWVDQLMPKMNNLLDQSKLWDLKATAYKQAGEESLAEE